MVYEFVFVCSNYYYFVSIMIYLRYNCIFFNWSRNMNNNNNEDDDIESLTNIEE